MPHAFWRQPATVSQALIVAPFFVFHGIVFLLLSLWAVWAWRRVLVGRQSLQSMPAEVMLITIALALAQASLIHVRVHRPATTALPDAAIAVVYAGSSVVVAGDGLRFA